MPASRTSRTARLNGRIGGLTYAANHSPAELSRRGRLAYEARLRNLEEQADPEGKLQPHERRRMAERRVRRDMTRLSVRRWRGHQRLAPVERPSPEELGHWAEGEGNPKARHSDQTVRQARALRAEGWDLRRIAAYIGAHYSTVARWCRAETRRGAGDPGELGEAER